MEVQKIATIAEGQDGAVYGDFLFRFDAAGLVRVYEMEQLCNSDPAVPAPEYASFRLDRCEEICPHSNSVQFSSRRFCESDEFPLLYTNIYNNYSKAPDPLIGVCCVYRLQRSGTHFTSTLLQLIRIGFTDDPNLWCSDTATADVRPYGNFLPDPEQDRYYAFVMRDADCSTRYFAFNLPDIREGLWEEEKQIRVVTLHPEEILDRFSCEYHHYLQGCCVHEGRIYSLEGFAANSKELPVLRVINPKEGLQEQVWDLSEYGMPHEPELIDFYDGNCYYSDCHGNLYRLVF